MFQMKPFLLVLSLVAGVHTVLAVFIEEPSSVVVAENDTAVFRCRISSGVQGWAVGGQFVDTQNSTNFTTRSEPASDGGPPVHTLSIVGRSADNGITVQCFSLSFGGNSNSSIATLQIQGLLAAVSELSATLLAGSILFSWVAPFSLNLTNTEPDITYCVDVLSSGGAGLVAGGCGLNETQYSFTADVRSPCDTFTAVVTPVNGAGNGTASQPVTGTFFAAPVVPKMPNMTVKFPIQPLRTFNVSVNFSLVVYACNYTVIIESSDGPTLQPVSIIMPVDKTVEGHTLNLTLNTSAVPLNRNYSLEIFLKNSAGSATTMRARLSTHDVQDLRTPTSSSNEELIIDFAENSNAPGCLVIVAGSDLEMFYIGYRDPGVLRDILPMPELPEGSYEVAVYDVERDSMMPGTHAADNETLVIDEPQPETDSDAEISEGVLVTPNDDREICVNCTIPADVSATECVVITHPAGSLNEIKTFPVLNDTVGCEPVPTSQAYYVATFGRLDDRIVSLTKQQTPTDDVPSGGVSVIILVVVVVVAMVIVVTVLVVVPLLIFLYKRGKAVEIPLHSEPDKPSEPNPEMCDNVSLLVLDGESPPAYDSVVTTETPVEASGGPPPPISVPPCSADSHDEHKDKPQSKAEGQSRLQSDYNSPALSQESFDLPPPIPERLYDTEPDESVSTKTSFASSSKPDPLYETVKPPDKKVSHGKAGTEPMYASTTPCTKFIAPPKQDTEVHYDVAAAYKSDGKTYAIANVKPPKDDTERPTDKNAVAYGTIDHLATAKSKPKREATAVPAAVPALSAPTKDLLCERLYKVKKKWMDLGKQFKQDEDRLDRIFTSDEENEACLLGVIEYWLMNGDFQHTWSEVVTALEAIGEHTLAKKIRTEFTLPADMPNLPGIPIHEHSQAESPHTAVDMEGAAKVAAEHIVVDVEQDVSPTATNGSDHADEEDTYQTSGGERFSSEGLCDNSIHEHSIDCEYPKQEVTSKTNGDDKVDRKVGDIVGVGSPQKMVQAPRITVTRGECIDYNDDSKCNHPIQDCKESFDDKRNCLFSHEVYLLWRNVSNKSGKQAQHDRNLGPKEVSRCLYYSEEAELNLVPHASSQPESDEEEGKITLDSSPALELLNHAKEMSIVGREHILSANFEMVPVEEKDEFADDLPTADEATGNTHCVPHTNGFATRKQKAGRKTSIAHFSNRGSINGRGSLCFG